jgi:hypothetical protein
MAPITINGHKAYGVFIEPGMGLRNNSPKGTAVDDQPEDQYWVVNGQHFNGGCCFDYGNAEIDSRDDGNGTMETAYFGNATPWYHGPAPGPWVMTDQENNLVGCVNPGSTSKLCPNLPSITSRFETGIAKGEPHHWTSMGGDSQTGDLQVMYDGQRVDSSYDPMRKQGAILLGNGGDNSNGSQGTFYEGVMTKGFPADSVDQAVQANIRAAKYDVPQVSVAPPLTTPGQNTVPRIPGKFGNAIALDGTSSAVQLPNGIVSGLHDFTISAWVNPSSTPTWARIFDFGTGTDKYMFLAASAGSTPRFAITVNGNGANGEQIINAPTPLPLGQWTNITITLAGNTGTMYVNGQQVAQNTNITLTPSSMGNTNQNYIGKSQYPDPLLPGAIDDFQIYDHALSASEVGALQTAPGNGNVASYKFDEASGATVADSSGNNKTASVIITSTATPGPPGVQTFSPGSTQDTIVTYTNTTGAPVSGVKLGLDLPAGWSYDGPATVSDAVAPGASVSKTFKVTSGAAAFNGDIVGTATWGDGQSASMAERVRNTSPIKINEFRIGSTGNSTNSFIELYNAGDSNVDLSGWTLTEHATQQATFSTIKVPNGVTIGAHRFWVLGLANSGLAAPASAGDTTINVRSVAGMTVGDTVDVDGEAHTITAVGTAATGNTTLWQPEPDGPITVPAGATNVPVTSTSGFVAGQKVLLGSGSDLEVGTVSAVGKPGVQARLSAAAPAGATNLKVTSVNNISVGDKIRLDIASEGHGVETVTVTAVGTSGASGTGLTIAAPLQYDHASNLPFADSGTGITLATGTQFAHSSDEPVQALGTGITLDSPLTRAHDVNAPVRDAAVTTAGYQGTKAPNQWFGGPAFSTSAGSMVLKDAAGNASDSLNYGLLVDPWLAEGYQAGSPGSGCMAPVPSSAGTNGRSIARFPDGEDTDSNCADFRSASGTFTAPTPGTGNFVTTVETPVSGGVGGDVPATLSLTLGTPAAFGAFTPGVAKLYDASTTANVISTAGDATLSISDPSTNAPGHLVNGSFTLPTALTAKASSPAGAGGAFAPLGATPTTLLTYTGPVANDPVTVNFEQAIGANDALRTGSYSKTLTFTLSTTTP